MRKLFLVITFFILTGCANQYYLEKQDLKTGLFPTQAKADIIENNTTNLDSLKDFILVTTDFHDPDDLKQAVTIMNYFEVVMNGKDGKLEDLVIQQGLAQKIPDLSSRAALNKIAKYYKPFLWLNVEFSRRDSLGTPYMKFNLRNTLSFESYFIAEAEATDRDALLNAFSNYIKENSSR